MNITDSVASLSSDQIARVHRAPGDRDAFAHVSTGKAPSNELCRCHVLYY